MLGESLEVSLEKIATALTAYDRKINSLQRFHYTYDPRCVALSTQSLQLALRGYFDQAKAAEQEALESALEFNHPQTTGLVFAYKLLREEFQQDYVKQEETIDAMVRHGREHKISFWIFWADIFRGFAMARRGRAPEGLEIIEKSLQAFGQMKFNFYKPYHLGLKARAYEIAGDLHKALTCIAEGITFAEEKGERVMLADLIRFSGQLHLARDGPTAEKTAERLFVQAIELAQAQASKLHQIRAATALARLWQAQGKPSEAREILSPVYNWFSEGLSSPALAEARGVLDGLSVDLQMRRLIDARRRSPPILPQTALHLDAREGRGIELRATPAATTPSKRHRPSI
jgi:predicted ATPase